MKIFLILILLYSVNSMNETYNLQQDIIEPKVYELKSKENLGTVGVFISSLLLSLGGCISMVMSSIRKSRCVNIKCGKSSCIRDVPELDLDD